MIGMKYFVPIIIFIPMNKLLRILIATIISAIALIVSVALILLIFDVQAPKIAGLITIGIWVASYKLIKPTKKEEYRQAQKLINKYVENYHPNGVLKEKGEVIAGRREGNWDIFNEEGLHVKTIYYEEGEERYSKNADPL